MNTPTPIVRAFTQMADSNRFADALARIEAADCARIDAGTGRVYAIEICTPTLGCNTYIRRVAKDRRDAVAVGRAYARAAGIKHAGIRARLA